MEVPYIFALLNTIAIGVHVYSIYVFKFAHRGLDYLSSLTNKESEKLSDDPAALDMLRIRDLPNAQFFVAQKDTVKPRIAAVIIINIINYVMYPYDSLLYPWMEYILVGAAIFSNFDILLIAVTLHRNKEILSRICNAYYDITLRHEENMKIEKTVISIDDAFNDMMKDLNEVFKEDNNKNEDDEK